MEIEVQERGAFGWALVRLSPGERFVSEAGALFRISDNIDFDVTTRSRGAGGLMSGIKRMLASESFSSLPTPAPTTTMERSASRRSSRVR